MSVSSIFAANTGSLSPASSLLQSLGSTSTSSGSTASGADSASLSQAGKLFSQLQQLASTNPTGFQQVTSNIASQLNQAASQQTGSAATALTNLANKFEQASQSGSAAGLAPAGHHGGHRHGGGGGLSSLLSSASNATAPATSTSLIQSAVGAYSQQASDPFDAAMSIVQNALGGTS